MLGRDYSLQLFLPAGIQREFEPTWCTSILRTGESTVGTLPTHWMENDQQLSSAHPTSHSPSALVVSVIFPVDRLYTMFTVLRKLLRSAPLSYRRAANGFLSSMDRMSSHVPFKFLPNPLLHSSFTGAKLCAEVRAEKGVG